MDAIGSDGMESDGMESDGMESDGVGSDGVGSDWVGVRSDLHGCFQGSVIIAILKKTKKMDFFGCLKVKSFETCWLSLTHLNTQR
jgi:hypothetical protein